MADVALTELAIGTGTGIASALAAAAFYLRRKTTAMDEDKKRLDEEHAARMEVLTAERDRALGITRAGSKGNACTTAPQGPALARLDADPAGAARHDGRGDQADPSVLDQAIATKITSEVQRLLPEAVEKIQAEERLRAAARSEREQAQIAIIREEVAKVLHGLEGS